MSEFKDDTFLARWLNDELNDDELKAFKESEEYATYMRIRAGAELIDSPAFDQKALLDKIRQEKSLNIGPVASGRKKLWIYSAAASILLLMSFAIYSIFFSNNLTTYETTVGQKLSVNLPDGSKVVLNANSSLTFSTKNWDDERAVQLDGEGFFKVEKGQKFTVHTEMGEVSVLGTEFTVQELDGFFQVMCFEGSVKVLSEDEEEVLKPKRGIRKTRGSRMMRRELLINEPAWLENKSTFVSVPLIHALKEFQNQYNIQFEVADSIKNQTYTGGFPHGNLDLALEVFLGSIDVQYEKKGNVVLLSN